MPAPKGVESEKTFRAFKEIRSEPSSMRYIFSDIEGRELDHGLDLPESLQDMDKAVAEFAFLSRYTIAVVKDLVNSPGDQDIILAAYGFLDGYEKLNVTGRHELYCRNIGKNTTNGPLPLDIYWPQKSIRKNMNSKENAAITKMLEALIAKRASQGANLSYIDMAKELCNGPFPTPNYVLGNGYRKCEIDGGTFYVPLSDKEFRSLSNDRTTSNKTEKPKNGNSDESLDYDIEDIDGVIIDEVTSRYEDELLLSNVVNTVLSPIRIRWIKRLKIVLAISIIFLIITIIFGVWRDKNIAEKEGEFQEKIPQSVLDGIRDMDIDSGDWEYTEMKDGKIYKIKVSVSHEQITDKVEPDE